MTDTERLMLKVDEGKIASHYGKKAQLRKTQEELMELYDAIGGYLSGADTEEHVKEEAADAEVMIDQIKLLLHCWDEVNDIKRYKVCRQLKRMEAEK